MSTLRLRRLAADYRKLQEYVARHPRLTLLRASGDPPESYEIEYKIVSLRQAPQGLERVPKHVVEIQLPRDYPRMPPQCRMLTPVFHPNIAPHAICVGDHWSAGEPIGSIVARIGEMLAYQSYNTKSPLNGEAARWAEENTDKLPLDRVSMVLDAPQQAKRPLSRPAGGGHETPAVVPVPVAAQGAPVTVAFHCPECGEKYKVPVEFQGKKARCKKCQAIMIIPHEALSEGARE